MKIRKKSLPAALLILSFTRLYSDGFYYIYVIYRVAILSGLLLCFANQFKKINTKVVLSFISFMIVALYSTINNSVGIEKIVQCLIFFLTILSMYLVTAWYKEQNLEGLFIQSVFRTLLFLCLASDFLSLMQRGADYYLLGTKFMVSYIHLFLIFLWQVLYLLKNKRIRYYKAILVLISIDSIFIIYWVGCTTALLLFPFTILSEYFIEKNKFYFQNRVSLITAFIGGNFLVLGMGILATNEKIVYFITQTLGKGASYWGRLIIYEKISEIIANQKWFGYGYTSDIVNQVVTFGNAQNGMLDIVIQYGIIGLLCWGCFVLFSCRNMKETKLWPIYAFIYCIVFASYIEISFNMFFYLSLAIVGLFGANREHKNQRHLVITKRLK